jgi:hypothetical protein
MTNVALGEEISWLRGWGWNAARIAKKLECPIELVLNHLRDYTPDEKDLLSAGRAARHEARLVYSRTVRQWRADG